MVGLAAPQIGYGVRLVFIDTEADKDRRHGLHKNVFMVNPKILEKSRSSVRGLEGCYSAKSDNFDFRGIVSRSKSVTVQYLDLNGRKQVQKYVGFTAVIVQHEIDHLEGKVFVHRITKEKDLHIVLGSESKKYKKTLSTWNRCLSPKLYLEEIAKITTKNS